VPIEIAFRTNAADCQKSLRKLKILKAEHGDEVNLFCTRDQREFVDWTGARGSPDVVAADFVTA
jgi:hypothetical protein